MDDFRERLETRLRDTAASAGARPRMEELERRARRQRRTAGALGGGATLAVVVMAVAVVAWLPLTPNQGVELDGDVADRADRGERPDPDDAGEPEPDDRVAGGEADDGDDGDEGGDGDDGGEGGEERAPDAAHEPAPPADACGSLDRLALVVAAANGSLEAVCADGTTAPIAHDSEGQARHVDIAADGSALVIEEARGDGSALVRVDAASGEATELGEGRMPALSPDGLLAWVAGDEVSPTVMVGEPGEEPAAEHLMGTMIVKGLAWGADGESLLLVDNFPEGAGLSTLEALDPEARVEAPGSVGPEGSRVLAAAPSQATGRIGVVHRVGTDEGLRLSTTPGVGTLGDLRLERVADLDELDLAVGELPRAQDQAELWVDDTPGLRRGDDGELTAGHEEPLWLVGDGEVVWLVGPVGEPELLAEGARHAVANPLLRGAAR